MPNRYDYYDDPAAPPANSLVPSVNIVVTDDDRRILMIRRTDNGNWAVPGGAIELGESLVGAAIRETLEETGITCEVTGLVGIYTDPKHVIHYTSNDEVRQEFSIVLAARPVSDDLTPSIVNYPRPVLWDAVRAGVLKAAYMDDEEVVTSGRGSDVSAGGLQHGRQAEDRRIIFMN